MKGEGEHSTSNVQRPTSKGAGEVWYWIGDRTLMVLMTVTFVIGMAVIFCAWIVRTAVLMAWGPVQVLGNECRKLRKLFREVMA